MVKRHTDDGRGISSFANDVWVRCPKCESLAHVAWAYNRGARLICGQCGFRQATAKLQADWRIREGVDPFFGNALWIQGEFRCHALWFYNPDHLDYVRAYVEATLRGRAMAVRGRANSTLTSRLPRWIKASKNRDYLLKAMAKLRARCL